MRPLLYLPLLCTLLHAGDEITWRGKTVQQLAEDLKSKDDGARRSAVEGLRELGPKAAEATAALVEALHDTDPTFTKEIPSALTAIGAGAVPALVEALRDPRVEVRTCAAQSLAQMGPLAKEALSALLDALKDDDPRVRALAADALANLGARAKDAVPPLLDALSDKDAAVVQEARRALVGIGSPSVPHIVTLLRQGDPGQRVLAASMLSAIRPRTRLAFDALKGALSDEVPDVRRTALAGVWRYGERQADVVALLASLAVDADVGVRIEATTGLAEVASNDPTGIDLLGKAQKDADPRVRAAAARGLVKGGMFAVPLLVTTLSDPDLSHRRDAVRALWGIGPEAREAVSALTAALKDTSWEVRQGAAVALGAIGPEAEEAIPLLEELKKDSVREVREAASRAIDQIR